MVSTLSKSQPYLELFALSTVTPTVPPSLYGLAQCSAECQCSFTWPSSCWSIRNMTHLHKTWKLVVFWLPSHMGCPALALSM